MTHLTEVELVDLLDGTLASSRAVHVDECERCRATTTVMREALSQARDMEVPEPSPLFWEHFSARVHDGVRDAEVEQPPRWFEWADWTTVKWPRSGAVVTLAMVAMVTMLAGVWAGVWRTTAPVPTSEQGVPGASLASVATGAIEDANGLPAFDAETDEAWALVRTVADEVTWDEAAADGFGVRPGSVESALVALTGDERSELVRLLEAETRKRGA